MAIRRKVTLLAGGFGGARMAHGFALLGDTVALSVIVNTADDLEVHGLHVSPDLDTVMYTLGGIANDETGWGMRDETWSAAEMLDRYGEPTWFRLGDRDLATHIVRTARLRQGQRLTAVTRALCDALRVSTAVLPMSDQPVRTRIRTRDGWLDFQDYFVRRRHRDEVIEVSFDGLDAAAPTPEVMAAIRSADLVVIAPSNPYVSVEPILALDGVEEALRQAAAPVVAVSPIVGRAALRGPAAHMLRSLESQAGAAGVAHHYQNRHPGVIDTFVIDEADDGAIDAIEGYGLAVLRAPIVIPQPEQRRELARMLLGITSITTS